MACEPATAVLLDLAAPVSDVEVSVGDDNDLITRMLHDLKRTRTA